jgi:hypothetical protein
VIAGVINGHVAAKYIYVRLFRGTDCMQKRSVGSIGSWVAITLILWVIAWVIAEAIPVFNDLLSLIVSVKIPMAPAYETNKCAYRPLSSQAGSRVSALKRKKKTVLMNIKYRRSQWNILVILELGTVW